MRNTEGCMDCPRECGADREHRSGYCGAGVLPRIARAALHFWEEPCISGSNGSGAVFFAGCNLRCVYCQNRKIALGTYGTEVSAERLAEIFLELQEQGAHNINLVTPSHVTTAVIQAIELAKRAGMKLPVVYNTGSYEKVDNLKRLEGLVDVWLPDLKYFASDLSAAYSNAPDYFEVASHAIEEMYRQAGALKFVACTVPEVQKETEQQDAVQLIERGVIVRHLVLPGHQGDSKRIIKYLHDQYGENIFISIMNQYTPVIQGADAEKFPELTRKVKQSEYNAVVDYAIKLGIENAFIQEGETAKESFIPEFDGTGV